MQNKISEAIESLKETQQINLKDFLHNNFSNKETVIYGAGAFGEEIFKVLHKNKIFVTAFLDKYKVNTLLNIPITKPENFENKDVTIILAIVLNKKSRNEIIDYLKDLGFKNIVDAQEIRARYVHLEDCQNNHIYSYFNNHLETILNPLNFLEDKESKETYTSAIVSHIKRDYSNCYESDEINQYFLENIKFKKDFSKFIDCGAYIGDTFEILFNTEKRLEEYIGFEPVEESYKKLVNLVSKKNIKSILLPLAVSDDKKIVNFTSNYGSSNIHESGNEQINCIKLDDILHGYSPTFIKMDIEGEEIKALLGAKELITNATPDLAICVYHYINHFWEIPNLINSWNLGYKFYLRTHSSACMETVLYAIKEEDKC